MESLSFFELKSLSQWLQDEMHGAQLQDLWTNGQLVVFQFYKFKEIYLIIEANPQKPLLIYSEVEPKIEKKQKPLVLFLHSHGKNLRWENCNVPEEKGRVLEVELTGGTRSCHLEIQLIPKSFNLLVEADGKKIAWEKPRELPLSKAPAPQEIGSVDWVEFGQKWFEQKFNRTSVKSNQSLEVKAVDPRPKALEKKKKALAAIEEQLRTDSSDRWKALGEALKVSAEVPDSLKDLYQSQKSRSWNLENAFTHAKNLDRKRVGTESRRNLLQEEIQKLEKDILENPNAIPQSKSATSQSASRKLMEKSNSKGRRLQLEDGVEAVIGKSAADNLAILRQAKAWDLWLHLKDYPGSHAIILRPRQKEISQNTIQKVSEWVIRESLSSQKIQWGAKYDVVVVECRHVRPIKGDRLGRVTYHHPQVYSFASKS